MPRTPAPVTALHLSVTELEDIAFKALHAAGASRDNARSMARAIARAEAEGLRSHGLLRLPAYCEQLVAGKIDGGAQPTARSERAGVWCVDARDGFAHPAIELGFTELVPAARAQGLAALAIRNSYNCGVVGHHVEDLAREGLVALAFANTPAAIAPWGGSKAFFGTNPIALAAPRAAGEPLVLDQSASVVARGEVMLHAAQDKPIPEGWALDAEGQATRDARAALAGSMLPAGGYKGAGVALMVEVLAAALVGATLSFEASSFTDAKGGPPRTGQLFIALEPGAFGDGSFRTRIEHMIEGMLSQEGVRLPGARRAVARERAAASGIEVDRALYERVNELAGGAECAAIG